MGPRRAQQGAATRAGNVLAPTPSAERPTTADLYSIAFTCRVPRVGRAGARARANRTRDPGQTKSPLRPVPASSRTEAVLGASHDATRS